jgi:hypothetical protein
MRVRFSYLRRFLVLPLGLGAALATAAALVLAARAIDRRRRVALALAALVCAWPVRVLLGSGALAWAVIAAALVVGYRAGLLQRLRAILAADLRALPERFRQRPRPARSFLAWIGRGALALAMAGTAAVFCVLLLRVVWVLGRPY